MVSKFYVYSIILFCLVIAFFMVRRMTERGGLGRLILSSIVAVFGAVCLTVVLVS